MEDIYYRVYDIFADIRDTIADVADKFIAFATGIVYRVLCRVGWWVLDAIVYPRFRTHCHCHNVDLEDCPQCPHWIRTAEKIGQWLVGQNS